MSEKATGNKPQSPPAVENAAGQEAGAEPQEPTIEQLKQAVTALAEEKGKSQAEVKRLQGVIRSQGVTKQDIAALRQEFGGMQEWVADALDKMNTGETGELNDTPKTSYKEKLAASKQASQAQEQAISPEDQLAYGYAISQGLTPESPEVVEAFSDGRRGIEAHEYLKSLIAGKSEAARKAEIAAAVQATLKEHGLTQTGVGAPTTGGTKFTLDKIKSMPDEELIENQEAILKAMVEGGQK